MSAFGIWAIILTGCYLVYYPVVIALDLFGKKGQKRDGVEEFDTGGVDSSAGVDEDVETPTDVVDTGNGYRVGDEHYDPDEDDLEPVREEVPPVPLTAEEQQREQFTAMKDRIENQLNLEGETVNPSYQQSMTSESFLLTMQMPLNKKSRIKRDKVL